MQHWTMKISLYFIFAFKRKNIFIPLYWNTLTLTNFLYCGKEIYIYIQRLFMQKEGAHERKRANAKLVNAKGTFLPQPPAWPPVLCCPPPCSSLHLLLVHLLWGQKVLIAQLFIIRTLHTFKLGLGNDFFPVFVFGGFTDHLGRLNNSWKFAHFSSGEKFKGSQLGSAAPPTIFQTPPHWGDVYYKKMQKNKNMWSYWDSAQRFNVGSIIC